METYALDALLSNGKALLCVILILILMVAISTSLTFCQYFQSKKIIERLANLELKTDQRNAGCKPAYIHDIKIDSVHYVNEKTVMYTS